MFDAFIKQLFSEFTAQWVKSSARGLYCVERHRSEPGLNLFFCHYCLTASLKVTIVMEDLRSYVEKVVFIILFQSLLC